MPSKQSKPTVPTVATKPPKSSKASLPPKARRFTPASFKSRRKRRKAEKTVLITKIDNSFKLFWRSLVTLRNHWEIFGGLFVLFAVVNTILALGPLLQIDLAGAKAGLKDVNEIGQVGTGLALYGTLLTSGAGASQGAAGAYQTILVVIISLAMVWSLRQLAAGKSIRVRDALFHSTYPLNQVLVLLLLIFLQLMPSLIASYLIYNLLSLGIITVGWQQALVILGCFLLVLWTVYMVIGSMFSLYIATLPDMTPLKAWRASKDIVRYRRASVLRKLLFLPIGLLIVSTIILAPLSIVSPTGATIGFFVMAMATLPLIHSYLYTVYRELIK